VGPAVIDLYRYSLVRRAEASGRAGVQLPEPDPPAWTADAAALLDQVPRRAFVDAVLGLGTRAPTRDEDVEALLEALGATPAGDPARRREQLRDELDGGKAAEVLRALSSLIAAALGSRPRSDDVLAQLVSAAVAVQTCHELFGGARSPDDWEAGLRRPVVRPRGATARRSAITGRVGDAGRRGVDSGRLDAIERTLPVLRGAVHANAAFDEVLRRLHTLPLGDEVLVRLRETNLRRVVADLDSERRSISMELRAAPGSANRAGAFVGGPLLAGLAEIAADRRLADVLRGRLPEIAADASAEPARVRRPCGLQPVGRQELLVVRSRHLGYRLAELSHVENIAPGEIRDRLHRTETELDTLVVEEEEHESETKDDLSTTTKDELRTEIQREMQEQSQLSGKVRSSYRGPVTVEVEAAASRTRSTNRQENQARNHAVEVTQQASTRARDRVLRRTQRRFRRLVAESNQHRFENPSPEGRSAQYLWLQKVERVAIYRYGDRQLYELVVPEPAAGLRSLTASSPRQEVPLKPPPTALFEQILAEQVDVVALWHSGELAKHFVVDVVPPKEELWVQTVLQSAQSDGSPSNNFLATKGTVEVPEGRVATALRLTVQTHAEGETYIPALSVNVNDFDLWVNLDTLDRRTKRSTDARHRPGIWSYRYRDGAEQIGPFGTAPYPGVLTFERDLEEHWPAGSHEVAVLADDFTNVAVTTALKTVPTADGRQAWRRRLLAAVVEDYWRQYESYVSMVVGTAPATDSGLLEKLSDAQAAELREIERDEIKRAVVAVLRDTDATTTDPVNGSGGGPRVAEWYRANEHFRDEVLFLEQAFEWEHMNFVLYGYHWSDPRDWSLQIFGLRGGDRPFREFLKAGAARVQIPVRPGFEGFVEDFMLDGVVWSGGSRPNIGSAGYVDLLTERLEALGVPGDEAPLAEVSPDGTTHAPVYWDVTTPTDLVMLKTWDTPTSAPLDRMVPPPAAQLRVPVDQPCPDPLRGWVPGTGPVPDDPTA
jgi:hypothetical protein